MMVVLKEAAPIYADYEVITSQFIPSDQQALGLSSVRISFHSRQTDPPSLVQASQEQEHCLLHQHHTILYWQYHLHGNTATITYKQQLGKKHLICHNGCTYFRPGGHYKAWPHKAIEGASSYCFPENSECRFSAPQVNQLQIARITLRNIKKKNTRSKKTQPFSRKQSACSQIFK